MTRVLNRLWLLTSILFQLLGSCACDDVVIPCDGGLCRFDGLAAAVSSAFTSTNFILTPGTYFNCNQTALLQPGVNVTISAPGGATIDCRGLGSAFNFTAIRWNTTVVMSNLVIMNASNTMYGPAVYGYASGARLNITLLNMTFVNCTAYRRGQGVQPYGFGGAVYLAYTSGPGVLVLVQDCSFYGNTGAYGGAVALVNFPLATVTSNPPAAGFTRIIGTFVNVKASGNAALQNDDLAISGSGGFLGGWGAAVYASNLLATDNRAQNDGGALFLYSQSILQLRSSTFTTNSAKTFGGAIKLSTAGGSTSVSIMQLFIENVFFSGNYITGTTSSGGHIFAFCGGVTIRGSTFVGSTALSSAPTSGGLFYGNNVYLTATNNTFTMGKVTGSGSYEGGGALFLINADKVVMYNSSFNNCQSGAGGGAIYMRYQPGHTINNCTFANNQGATSIIGCDSGSGTYALVDTVFVGNTVTGAGPSIDVAMRLNLTRSNFTDNAGLASLVSYVDVLGVTDSVFVSNEVTAGNGGALSLYTSTIAIITRSSFSYNRASLVGGAIYSANAGATISGCDFMGNSAVNGGDVGVFQLSTMKASNITSRQSSASTGGSFFVDLSSSLSLMDSVITGSTSNGAIYVNSGSVTLTNIQISNCVSSNQGGAIYNNDVVILNNCRLTGNTAVQGGAIATVATASVNLVNSYVAGNAAVEGGAMYLGSLATAQISGTSFFNNSALLNGGAVATDYLSGATITGAMFDQNSASYGGGINLNSGSMQLTQCVMQNNSATTDGGAVIAIGTLTMQACTFRTNTAGNSGGALQMNANVGGSLVSSFVEQNSASLGAGIGCSGCKLSVATSRLTGNASPIGAAFACSSATLAFVFDDATVITGNNALLESDLQASCLLCGCCSYSTPLHLTPDAPCTPLPGRRCNYTCDIGYSVKEPRGVLCSASGELVEPSSYCPAVACPALNITFGMRIVPYGDAHNISEPITNDAETISCVPGFQISVLNAAPMLCIGPTWVGTQPQCRVLPCPNLGTLANGHIMVERFFEQGDNATYQCNDGYELLGGTAERQCVYPTWEGETRTCQAVPCNQTEIISAPLILLDKSAKSTGQTRVFTCATGHQFTSGDPFQYCVGPHWVVQETGALAATPSCTPIPCPTLPATPEHCTVTINKLVYLGTVTYSCDIGYEMLGGGDGLLCDVPAGEILPIWTGVVPTCQAIQCPALDPIVDTDCMAPYEYLESCTMGCVAGYSGLNIENYLCSQSAPNQGGNWTIVGGPHQAYFPTCDGCLVGSYIGRLNNRDHCTACENGVTASVLSTSISDCLCNPGYYEANPVISPGICTGCPPGAQCAGGHTPFVAGPGFFQTVDPNTGEIHLVACSPSAVCIGANQCLPGHSGYLCNTCLHGFYKLNGYCHPCPDDSIVLVVIGLVVAVIAAFILIITSRPGPLRERSFGFGSVPTAIGFVQMAASFYSFKLPWPTNTRKVFDGMSLFNVNIELLRPECAFNFSYYDRTRVLLAMPLVLLGVFMVVLLVWCVILLIRDRHNFRTSSRSVVSNIAAGFLCFLNLSYLLLARAAVEPLACSTQADTSVVIAQAPSLACYTTEWWSVAKFCVFGIVAYIFLIPATFLLLYLIYQPGEDAILDPLFSFYVGKYTPRRWWYEIVVMMRKLAIVLFAVFIGSQSVLQAVCVIVVLFISAVVTIVARPFRWGKHSILEVVMLAVLVVVIFGGLLMTFDTFKAANTADILIVVVVALAILAFLMVFVAELFANVNARLVARKLPAPTQIIARMIGDPRFVASLDDLVLIVTADETLIAYRYDHAGVKDNKAELLPRTYENVGFVRRCNGCVVTASTQGHVQFSRIHINNNDWRLDTFAEVDIGAAVGGIVEFDSSVAIATSSGRVVIVEIPTSPTAPTDKLISGSVTSGSVFSNPSNSEQNSTVSTSASISHSVSRGSSVASASGASSASSTGHAVQKLSIEADIQAFDTPVAGVALGNGTIYAMSSTEIKSWIWFSGKPQESSTWDLTLLAAGSGTCMEVIGANIVLGCSDHTIRILDEREGLASHTIHSHLQAISCLATVGHAIVSGGRDGVVKLWEVETWRYLQTLGRFSGAIVHLSPTADGRTVHVVCDTGVIAEMRIMHEWDIDRCRKDPYDACFSQRDDRDIAVHDASGGSALPHGMLFNHIQAASSVVLHDVKDSNVLMGRMVAALRHIETTAPERGRLLTQESSGSLSDGSS